jgi:hypothetical protein
MERTGVMKDFKRKNNNRLLNKTELEKRRGRGKEYEA